MATLPTVTYYWRQSGAADDAWTEDADGGITPTAGQTIEVVSVGPSKPAFKAADTTPTVSLTDISVSYGTGVTVNPTYGGTNRVYALSGPDWLSINASNGQITGTAPSANVDTTYTVTVSNASGTASATADVTVSATVPTVGRTLTGSEYWIAEGPGIRDRLYGASAITFSGWLKIAGAPAAGQLVFSALASFTAPSTFEAGLALDVLDSGAVRLQGRSAPGDTFRSATTDAAIPVGTWVHVAGVIDYPTEAMTIYINGSAVAATVTAAGGWAQNAWLPDTYQSEVPDRIGINPAGTVFFEGDLADFAFYRRALSSGEISAIAAGGSPRAATGGLPALHLPMASTIDGPGSGLSSYDGQMWLPTGNIAASATAPNAPIPDAPTGLDATPRLRVLRLKASDAAAVGAGNPVSSIPLGHGYVAAASGAERPTYEVESGVGRLRFTGTQNLAALVGAEMLGRGITTVALVKWAGTGDDFARIWSIAKTGDTEAAALINRDGMAVNTSSNYVGATQTTTSDLVMHAGRWSGIGIRNWRNGVPMTGGTALAGVDLSLDNGERRTDDRFAAQTIGALNIGRRVAGVLSAAPFVGDVIDIIWIVGACTDDDVAMLEGIVAWDNGAESLLPVGHPYASAAPAAAQRSQALGMDVVSRSPEPGRFFVASPSVAVAANGDVLIASDWFQQPQADMAAPWVPRVQVHRIKDGRPELMAGWFTGFWPTIWRHTDGHLYCLDNERWKGNHTIRKSTDNGRSWSAPMTINGIANMPVAGADVDTQPFYGRGGGLRPCYHDGKLFFAGYWNTSDYTNLTHREGFFWADGSSDLMQQSSWSAIAANTRDALATVSTRTAPNIPPGPGIIEPNVVVDGTGQIYIIARVTGVGAADINTAVKIPMGWNGTTASWPTWDESAFLIDMPGGNVKFDTWVYGGKLWAAVNPQDAALAATSQDQRNRVDLISTPIADLSGQPTWTTETTLFAPATVNRGATAAQGVLRQGLQYFASDLAGSTLHYAIRSGLDGSKDFHDSNFITYGTVDLDAL